MNGQPYSAYPNGYGNVPPGTQNGQYYRGEYPSYGARPPYPYGGGGNHTPPIPPQNSSPFPPPVGRPRGGGTHSSGKKIVLWVVAILLELGLVAFAALGIYALGSGALSNSSARPLQSSESDWKQPQVPENENSSSAENTSNVQMGITCVEMTEQVANYYQIDLGLIVYMINPDSNANQTNLQLGDVITHANGVRVTTFQELFDVMEGMNPGDEMTLTVYRMNEQNQPSSPFEVSFAVQEKQEEATSSAAESNYPFA